MTELELLRQFRDSIADINLATPRGASNAQWASQRLRELRRTARVYRDHSDPAAISSADDTRSSEGVIQQTEAWLRAVSDWLLANDLDMKMPSGTLDTDPLDLADALAALTTAPATPSLSTFTRGGEALFDDEASAAADVPEVAVRVSKESAIFQAIAHLPTLPSPKDYTDAEAMAWVDALGAARAQLAPLLAALPSSPDKLGEGK